MQHTFCLLDRLNSRQSKINFVFGESLNCRLRVKEKRLFLTSSCFSYLFDASTRLFLFLIFAQSRKMQKEELCNDDVSRASVL